MKELTIIIRAGRLTIIADGVQLEPTALTLEYREDAPLLLSFVLPMERGGTTGGEYIS